MTNIISTYKENRDFFKNLCVIALWYPIGFVAIYVHVSYLNQHVFPFIGSLTVAELSFVDKIPYLARTALDYFIILPFITWALLHFMSHWSMRVIIFSVALFILWINFNNMISFATTGHFISLSLLIDAFYWGKEHPEIIEEYADRTALMAFLAFVVILSICYFGQHVKCPKKRSNISQCFKFPALILILISFIGFVISKEMITARHASFESFLGAQLSSFVDYEYTENVGENLPDNILELTKLFKLKTKSIMSEHTKNLPLGFQPAQEKNSNIIFIIMETGPKKAHMDEKFPELFKNFNALKQQSFYSNQHLSSYLYTSDAMFSIFGSLYTDIRTRKDFLERRENKTTISGLGLFDHLNHAGYDTGVYSPALPIVNDDTIMFQMLGVKKQYYAENNPEEIAKIQDDLELYLKPLTDHTSFNQKTYGKLKLQVPLDIVTLNKMLVDIEENVKKGQKFASVFLPQIGHGPWPNVASAGQTDDIENAKFLMSLQDHWIGLIIDKLKKLGIFENTIIVITSDHGPRTITEFSSMNPNAINEDSYVVPFLIYAPHSLKHGIKLAHKTSHIDIMPTVLSLLDLYPARSCMLGVNIWRSDLKDRRLYMLGRRYTGIDGYSQDGYYYSYHAALKFAFKSDSFNFSKEDFIPKGTPEYVKIQQNINFQHGVQQKLLQNLMTQDCSF